jgi:hypothetical protein
MQAFLNDEARLQAESLPFLLPHAKKIDDLTKNCIAHRFWVCIAISLMRRSRLFGLSEQLVARLLALPAQIQCMLMFFIHASFDAFHGL